MRTAIVLFFVVTAGTSIIAADPSAPVFWSASQLDARQQTAKGKIDPTLHRGVERLIDSASLIYRDGPSEAEAHTDRADFISVREGRGTILIGGTMLDGKPTAAGEIRGKAIEGGTKYPVASGDAIYVPVNVPHQFLVEPGQHMVVTIVKVDPRR
jgi:mannose-6-phosphate isomerase-like protein (cupin superfamily)